MTISYLFLTVGDKQPIHNQVWYAIITLLAHDESNAAIYVVTDNPEYYDWFYPRVQCIPVSAQQLQEWQGPHQFFFRIKIKALQHLAKEVKNNLVYLDADTVCTRSLSEFENQLRAGNFFMHVPEFRLSSKPTKTVKQMWKVGAHKTFGSFRIDEHSMMWNAGVIGFSHDAMDYLEAALIACDAMCQAKMRPMFTEQFALSLALQQTGHLREAKHYFRHYWGNKDEWQNTVILPFLQKIHSNAWTLSQAISHLDKTQTYPADQRPKKTFFNKLETYYESLAKQFCR